MKAITKPTLYLWIGVAGLVGLGNRCDNEGRICDCQVDADCNPGYECDVPSSRCTAEGGIGGLCVPKMDGGEIEMPE